MQALLQLDQLRLELRQLLCGELAQLRVLERFAVLVDSLRQGLPFVEGLDDPLQTPTLLVQLLKLLEIRQYRGITQQLLHLLASAGETFELFDGNHGAFSWTPNVGAAPGTYNR